MLGNLGGRAQSAASTVFYKAATIQGVVVGNLGSTTCSRCGTYPPHHRHGLPGRFPRRFRAAGPKGLQGRDTGRLFTSRPRASCRARMETSTIYLNKSACHGSYMSPRCARGATSHNTHP